MTQSPQRHACVSLAALGVKLGEADVLAGARAEPRAEQALLRALHDLALLHSAGWPAQVTAADLDRAWFVADTPEDRVFFVQQHLRACGYSRSAIYSMPIRSQHTPVRPGGESTSSAAPGATASLPADVGELSIEGRRERSRAGGLAGDAKGGFKGQWSCELLLALGWLLAFSGALRLATARRAGSAEPGPSRDVQGGSRSDAPQQLWPGDTREAAHNVSRAREAEVDARARVGRLRRASLGLLARAAGRPGPAGEVAPSLAEAIVGSGHALLSLLGSLQLLLRRLLSSHLCRLRLWERAQLIGRELHLPAFAPVGVASAGTRGGAVTGASWTLFELWACTLGGTEAGAAAQHDAESRAHAGGGREGVTAQVSQRSKHELKRVLLELRTHVEARANERSLFKWLEGVAAQNGPLNLNTAGSAAVTGVGSSLGSAAANLGTAGSAAGLAAASMIVTTEGSWRLAKKLAERRALWRGELLGVLEPIANGAVCWGF